MVTFAVAEVDEREGKEKFSFTSITKRFKFRPKRVENDAETAPVAKKKFRFLKLFRRKKKQPDVVFDSGYGELMTAAFVNFSNANFLANFYRFNSLPSRKALCEMEI